MKRPCTCNRFTPGKPFQHGQCRLCWLYANDERYQKLWSEPGPTFVEQVKKVGKATAAWIAAGSPLRTTEELAECNAICQACPEYQPLLNRCGKCGCFLSAKARMATETCPLGKWPTREKTESSPQPTEGT